MSKSQTERLTAVFLSGFGDDSADETRKRVFAVASVVADDSAWESLERKWLDRTGGIPFHATDCDSDQGDYATIPHTENKRLYKDLSILLAESGVWGFGAAADLAGHDEFFPGVHPEMSYHNCFQKVVNFWVHRAADWKAKHIKFSFDARIQSDFNAGYLYSMMVNDKTQPHHHLLADEVSFLCSRKNPRIQIGDLYARECMKYLDNMFGPVKRPVRKSMQALIDTNRFGGDFYTREHFEDMHRRWDEIQKHAGFTQKDYFDWLDRNGLVDNVTNSFRFLSWLAEQEKLNPDFKL